MHRIGIRSIALAVLLSGASTVTAQAQKDLASCKPVLDATAKQFKTPTHGFSSTGGSAGTSSDGEIIFVGGMSYVKTRNVWRRSPTTVEEMAKEHQENIKSATAVSCKHVGDELTAGTPAAVYETTQENDGTKAHSRIWIAKSTGLPLRIDTDIDTGVAASTHRSIRYEYTNVQAPSGVK
ncbi:MAG: hypothetical protein ABJF01_16305 [bacterium]